MDQRYGIFCHADRNFYDVLDRVPGGAGPTWFEPALRPVPRGWRAARSGDWLHLHPEGLRLPSQGWKVHVSACPDNAEEVLGVVWDHCVSRALSFKYLPTRSALLVRNAKYAPREASGKFITVYPEDEGRLRECLEELGAALEGRPGPYVLSDLRVGGGPLYVRYGGFAKRWCTDDDGQQVPAIEDEGGRLVPDRRKPVFSPPEWITLPDFLVPHLRARNTGSLDRIPYRIERVLHYSNGGGVYEGYDTRTGDHVVLKEARPHAGLAAGGIDAVTRLRTEADMLRLAEGLPFAPRVHDWFVLDEHTFLVQEFIEGKPLKTCFAERHPLLTDAPDADRVRDYTTWALRVHAAAEEAVTALHDRGVVFNDLHMFNIIVRPDETAVALVDFEAATRRGDGGGQRMAHPGFLAPPDRTGVEVDRYCLACLRLALFLPLTTLLSVDRGKARHLAEVVAENFPVPPSFLDEAVTEIGRLVGQAPAHEPVVDYNPPAMHDWARVRDSMVRAVLASATPDRTDRLFPGDIAQFGPGGGLGMAHGAAGVLYALREAGVSSCEQGEDWLVRHSADPPPDTPVGFYDGLSGVAYALDLLGHRRHALNVVDRVLTRKWEELTPDLHAGLAGVGLALAHLADTTGESRLRAEAQRVAEMAAARLGIIPTRRPNAGSGNPRAGLLHGAAGAALLFLRLYDRCGQAELLDLAARALHRDLAACVRTSDGSLKVREPRRTMPYLGAGSAGIGAVIDEYLTRRHDGELAAARPGILRAASARYCAQPGLFRGRAGLLLHLAAASRHGANTRHGHDLGPELARQTAAMAWYAMPYRGGLAFPGDQLMRLSMDLATGTAGCLLGLAAALRTDRPAALPFFTRHPGTDPAPQGHDGRDRVLAGTTERTIR